MKQYKLALQKNVFKSQFLLQCNLKQEQYWFLQHLHLGNLYVKHSTSLMSCWMWHLSINIVPHELSHTSDMAKLQSKKGRNNIRKMWACLWGEGANLSQAHVKHNVLNIKFPVAKRTNVAWESWLNMQSRSELVSDALHIECIYHYQWFSPMIISEQQKHWHN